MTKSSCSSARPLHAPLLAFSLYLGNYQEASCLPLLSTSMWGPQQRKQRRQNGHLLGARSVNKRERPSALATPLRFPCTPKGQPTSKVERANRPTHKRHQWASPWSSDARSWPKRTTSPLRSCENLVRLRKNSSRTPFSRCNQQLLKLCFLLFLNPLLKF